MELSGKILKNMEKRIKISNQEIGYQTSYRDVKYPRLEFKTGSLILILPRNSKNEEEIIKTSCRKGMRGCGSHVRPSSFIEIINFFIKKIKKDYGFK